METPNLSKASTVTRLSSKGQVIIPKAIRTAHQWESGAEFNVIDTPEGVLLQPKALFAPSSLNEVAGCLPVVIKKTQHEIDLAIAQKLKQEWHDSN